MSARVPEKQRIRTVQIGWGGIAVATGVAYDAVAASYTFQDDVKIVGAQITIEVGVVDAHLNADAMILYLAELSRQAQRAMPGVIVMCPGGMGWTAAICLSGEVRRSVEIMFPAGYGIEVDEGEAINFLAFLQYTGAGGDLTFYGNSILYYVER